MSQNEFFEALQSFVPVTFADCATNFYYYLSTLPKKRNTFRDYSIDLTTEGVEVLIYRPQYTPTQFFTWSELQRLINKEYGVGFNLGTQITLFGGVEVQLKNSF